MNYAYTRVSTKTQDLENQAYGIKEWCKQHDVKINIWYEEKISGTKKWENRELNNIMQRLKPGDMIYATEVSRFGRSLVNVLNFFAQVKDKKCSIYCIKENFTLDDSLESQLMQTMYAFVADLSRRLLSQRIKEALQRKKADGIKLGRPFGCKNKHPSLEKHDAEIVNWLELGKSRYYIRTRLKTHAHTLNAYLRLKGYMTKYKLIDWQESNDAQIQRSTGYSKK